MRDATDYVEIARRAPGHADLQVPSNRIAEFAVFWLAPTLDPKVSTGGDVVAVVANHGRWLVTCPECMGALLAHPADPRFLCVDCGNADNGGKYRRVIWPKEYAEIAAVLDARADVATRNWQPGETVNDLKAENKFMPQRPTLLEPKPWHDPKWEGHTHRFPKRLRGDEVTCLDCGCPFPRESIEAHRQEESA